MDAAKGKAVVITWPAFEVKEVKNAGPTTQ